MPIVVRTEIGWSIAYAAESDIPLQICGLLKLIDGKADYPTSVVTLGVFSDVNAVFVRLLQFGYIQEVLGASPQSAEPEGESKLVDSSRDTKALKFNPSRWFAISKPEQSQQDSWDPTDIAQRCSFNVSTASSFDGTVNINQLHNRQGGSASKRHAAVHSQPVEHDMLNGSKPK